MGLPTPAFYARLQLLNASAAALGKTIERAAEGGEQCRLTVGDSNPPGIGNKDAANPPLFLRVTIPVWQPLVC